MKLRTQQEKKHLTKTLMYQRLVHYINLSLCKETYSPLEAVDKFKIIKSEIKKTRKKENNCLEVSKQKTIYHCSIKR